MARIHILILLGLLGGRSSFIFAQEDSWITPLVCLTEDRAQKEIHKNLHEFIQNSLLVLDNDEWPVISSDQEIKDALKLNTTRVQQVVDEEFAALSTSDEEALGAKLKEYASQLKSIDETLDHLDHKMTGVPAPGPKELLVMKNLRNWLQVSQDFHKQKMLYSQQKFQVLFPQVLKNEWQKAVMEIDGENEKLKQDLAANQKRAEMELDSIKREAQKDVKEKLLQVGPLGLTLIDLEKGYQAEWDRADELRRKKLKELRRAERQKEQEEEEFARKKRSRLGEISILQHQVHQKQREKEILNLSQELIRKNLNQEIAKEFMEEFKLNKGTPLTGSKRKRSSEPEDLEVLAPPRPPEVGILNGNNFCYMNSDLKILASFPLLDQTLQNPAKPQVKEDLRKQLIFVLNRLRKGERVSLEERDKLFTSLRNNGWKQGAADPFEQSDSEELLTFLIGLFNHDGNSFVLRKGLYEEGNPGGKTIDDVDQMKGGVVTLPLPPEENSSPVSVQKLVDSLTNREELYRSRTHRKQQYRFSLLGSTGAVGLETPSMIEKIKAAQREAEKQGNILNLVEKRPGGQFDKNNQLAPWYHYDVKGLSEDKSQLVTLFTLTESGLQDYLQKQKQEQKNTLLLLEQTRPYRSRNQILEPAHELTATEFMAAKREFLQQKRSALKAGDKTSDFELLKEFAGEEVEEKYIKEKSFVLKKGQTIPRHLTFQLGRFAGVNIKNKKPVQLDPVITMSFGSEDGKEKKDVRYSLVGLVDHHGQTLRGGHYTALIHHPESGGWKIHNDGNVSDPSAAIDLKHQETAYLAVYQLIE